MLADFWKALSQTITDGVAVKPTVLKSELQTDSRLIHYWHPTKESIEHLVISPPDRRHEVHTLAGLTQLATLASEMPHTKITVWVGGQSIRLCFDDHRRRDWATLPLVKSPLWTRLEQLGKNPLLSQADAIRLLRQELAPFDGDKKALVAARNLRMRRTEDGESTQNAGNAKMSRSIQQEAIGAHVLPETLPVRVFPFLQSPAFADGGRGYPVTLWIEPDLDRLAIRFEPDATELLDVLQRDQERLAEQIDANLAQVLERDQFVVILGVPE